MVHEHRQVAVPTLVADLIDPDAAKAREGIVCGLAVGNGALDDRPDGPPGDPHKLAHRRLGRVGDEPGDLVVEVPRVTCTVTGEGDLSHGRPMLGAGHPRRVSLEGALERPEVEAAPSAPALALVIAGRSHPAAPAAPPRRLAGTHVDDDLARLLVDLHVLDHDAPVDTEHPPPYVGSEQRRSPPPRFRTVRQPRS